MIIKHLDNSIIFLIFDKIAYFCPCFAKINTFLTPQIKKNLYLCKR